MFARAEAFWFALFKLLQEFAEQFTQLFSPSSKNLSSIWEHRVGVKIRKTRGVRWHSLFWNVNVAILNLSELRTIVEEFQTKKEAKKIQSLLSENDLIENMISTSLSGQFLQYKWEDLTRKQTKADLLNQLAELKSFCAEVNETEDFISLYKPCYEKESSFSKINELVNSVSNLSTFRTKHIRNFEKMIDYVVKNIQPDSSETNLEKSIGNLFN